MRMSVQKLLWFDSGGGLAAGLLVLFLRQELSAVEKMPVEVLTATGAANLLYGCYSGCLAFRASAGGTLPVAPLRLLVAGNAFWALLCLGLAAITWSQTSWFGTAHLGGEAIYVGTLAWVEHKTFGTREA